jgi:hypothetical protein
LKFPVQTDPNEKKPAKKVPVTKKPASSSFDVGSDSDSEPEESNQAN